MFKPTIDWHEGRISGPQIRMETIRYGVLQRAQNWVKTIKEDTSNNDNLVVSAICTETPEEALQELENSANPDDILWSRGTPLGVEGGRVEYIRCTQNAIEMAHEYAKSHQKEEVKLPDEFK